MHLRGARGYTIDMDEKLTTDDPNGTAPTDIIGDELVELEDAELTEEPQGSELAQTLERPLDSSALDEQDAGEEGETSGKHDGAEPLFRSRRPHRPVGSLSDVRDYIKRNPVAVMILVLTLLFAAYVLARAWRRTNNLPDLDFIEQDARARIEAPVYSGGYFGNDDRLILSQVTVGACRHSEQAPEGSDLDQTFGATSYATADVMVSYQNEGVLATKTATLGYAKQNEEWIDAGEVANEQVSFLATAGVNQRKALVNIGQLLERATSGRTLEAGQPSLATLYDGATYEVTSSTFDEAAQTDTLTISMSKGGRFSSYECAVVANFSFTPATGMWELASATVTDDAWMRRFDPLVGTWSGTFKSQTVNTGAKCLAGGDEPFSVTISSWESTATGARITGTLTAVAHFHQSPEKDQAKTEGDKVLENVPFTATLYEPEDARLSSEAVFIAALPENVGGNTSLTLEFGSGSDAAAVTATVTSEHSFEDTFLLIPYQNKVIYADTYTLTLEPEQTTPTAPQTPASPQNQNQTTQTDPAPQTAQTEQPAAPQAQQTQP